MIPKSITEKIAEESKTKQTKIRKNTIEQIAN